MGICNGAQLHCPCPALACHCAAEIPGSGGRAGHKSFYVSDDLSYKFSLSQQQCLQGHSASCISYSCCPELLTFSKNASPWDLRGIWEHPLSQAEGFQCTSMDLQYSLQPWRATGQLLPGTEVEFVLVGS